MGRRVEVPIVVPVVIGALPMVTVGEGPAGRREVIAIVAADDHFFLDELREGARPVFQELPVASAQERQRFVIGRPPFPLTLAQGGEDLNGRFGNH